MTRNTKIVGEVVDKTRKEHKEAENGKKNDDGRENKRLAKGPKMSFWCMVPGVIVNELCELVVKSLLLASGTLSPMDSFASALRAPFPGRLESPHDIPQHLSRLHT